MLTTIALVAQAAAVTAPADQYFGKLKMSALRIRYETMQLKKAVLKPTSCCPSRPSICCSSPRTRSASGLGPIQGIPGWRPPGTRSGTLFGELPGATARDHAVALYVYVKRASPVPLYATSSRTALHHGVPVKPDPAWAIAMRVPSPSPSPAATHAPSPAAHSSGRSPSPVPGSTQPPW